MKKLYSLLFVALFFCYSCDSKEDVGYYFSDSERDTLLTNIITYIGENARFSTDSTKFQSKYRAEYVSRLPLFHFVHLAKDTSGAFIYLISRPVAGRMDLRRGVVGRFTLKEGSLMPDNFEEVVNTPHFSEELVVERGSFLFKELVRKGKLDEYLSMKHYVEWPDKYLVYDKKKKTWVPTGVL
jgi:hypothetical protein